jgi:uncharacterized membrane protein (DUF373 family)
MSFSIVRFYERFEKWMASLLLVLLMITVIYMTGQFAYNIGYVIYEVFAGQREPIKIIMLREVFGGFMLLLIGIELMRTIIMYLRSHELHVEVVFSVAVIAVARHAILLSPEEQPMTMLGLGGLIVALGLGFFLFRRAELLRGRDDGNR